MCRFVGNGCAGSWAILTKYLITLQTGVCRSYNSPYVYPIKKFMGSRSVFADWHGQQVCVQQVCCVCVCVCVGVCMGVCMCLPTGVGERGCVWLCVACVACCDSRRWVVDCVYGSEIGLDMILERVQNRGGFGCVCLVTENLFSTVY